MDGGNLGGSEVMLAPSQPINPVEPSQALQNRQQPYFSSGQPQDQPQLAICSGPTQDSNNLVPNHYNQNQVHLNHSTLVIQQPQPNQSYSYSTSSNTQQQYPTSCYYQQVDTNTTNTTTTTTNNNSSSTDFGANSSSTYYNDFQPTNSGYQYFPHYQEQQNYHSQGYSSFAPRQDGATTQRFGAYHQPVAGPAAGNAPPGGAHPVKGSSGSFYMAESSSGGPTGAGGLRFNHSTHQFRRCLHPASDPQQRQQQQHHNQQQQHQQQHQQFQQHQQQSSHQQQLHQHQSAAFDFDHFEPTDSELGGGRRTAHTAARHHIVVAAAAQHQQRLAGRAQVMARRKNATRETTSLLRKWLSDNTRNPYPSKSEKLMLSMVTKMSLTQVSTWFANARRRMKKENKMLAWVLQRPGGRQGESSGSQAAAALQDPKRGSWYFRSLVELAASRSRAAGGVTTGRQRRPKRRQVGGEAAATVATTTATQNGDSESAAESPSTTSQLGAEEPANAEP